MDLPVVIGLGLLTLASFLYSRRESNRRIKELKDVVVELRKEMKRNFFARLTFDKHRELFEFVRDKKRITTIDYVRWKYPKVLPNTDEFASLRKKENLFLNGMKRLNLLIGMKGVSGVFKLSKPSKALFNFYETPSNPFINEKERRVIS